MSHSTFRLVTMLVGGLILGGVSFAFFNSTNSDSSSTTLIEAVESTTTTKATTTTTSTTTTSTTTTTTPPKETLVIQGVGDVNLDPTYIPALAANGYDYAWDGLDGIFHQDDLSVINLECAPSDIGSPEPKRFVFRCPTEALGSMAIAGVEVANLGNNHGGDYGKEALVDGRAQVAAVGVAPVGAGKDLSEAKLPAVFDVKGWRVAVVGLGGVKPHDGWFATEDRPGMVDGDDIPTIVDTVAAADAVADIVVVTIHWGVELDTTPRPEDVERARAMIDAGADIIFGHHPHRLQPLEIIDGAAVFWSLGNFIWPDFSVAGSTTGVARVVIDSDGTLSACLIPAFIENPGQPVLTGTPEC